MKIFMINDLRLIFFKITLDEHSCKKCSYQKKQCRALLKIPHICGKKMKFTCSFPVLPIFSLFMGTLLSLIFYKKAMTVNNNFINQKKKFFLNIVKNPKNQEIIKNFKEIMMDGHVLLGHQYDRTASFATKKN